MKKNLLLLSMLLGFSSLIYSQSDIEIIVPGNSHILNDSTIFFYVSPTVEYVSTINVINTTSFPLQVSARQDSINMLAGNANAICWAGFCSADYVNVAPNSETIAAHDTAEGAYTFNGDYTANGVGTSTVRYVFYNKSNPSDSSWILVNYVSTPTSVVSLNNKSIHFSAPYPNPANSSVTFSYNISNDVQSASLKLFNMLGECVQTLPLSPEKNKTTLDVQSVPSGIYICEVEADGCQPVYQKLIVSH